MVKCKKVEVVLGIEAIKQAIFKHGPVTAEMIVYEDLYYYKTGIYEHVTGEKVTPHAISIVGWGREQETDFWVIVNTWSDEWGDNGLFKIKQGDCGIDSYATGCIL